MSIIRGRNPHDLSRDMVRNLFDIVFGQPWLERKEHELIELLKKCKEEKETKLVKDLLKRFLFLDSGKTSISMSSLADFIVNNVKYPISNTQIVATTFDNHPDSAQMILQMLKPKLTDFGWNSVRCITQLGRALRDIEDYPYIILVDEFSGTGKSIIDRVEYLQKQVAAISKSKKKNLKLEIYVCLLCAMEEAITKIKNEKIDIHAEVKLKAGISGYCGDEERENSKNVMRRLESELKQDVNDQPFPSLGHGEAEALYTMENGNTPNSVFPIFWWRYYADGSPMYPILGRGDPVYA